MTNSAELKQHTIIDSHRRRLGTIVAAARQNAAASSEVLDVLEEKLDLSEGVSSWAVPDDVAIMNSRFRIRDLDSDELETYTLVYPDSEDVAAACVSVLSPLGAAVLGCRVGDELLVRAPAEWRLLRLEALLD